jgi:glycosyltransferase involved in cell wall biosynthesis
VSDGLVTVERSDPEADVLVVTNHWPTDENPGYGIFMRRQLDSLVRRGLRCDVMFVRGYRSPLAYPAAALRLLRMSLGRRRYRLVHAHAGETALAAMFHLRTPLVVSYCGDDLLGTPDAGGAIPWRSRLRRGAIRALSRRASATITKSPELQSALPERVARRNTVAPNGVDDDAFRPLDRAEARARLGFEDADRVVLFAAPPSVERKRYPLAKAACEAAAARVPGVRLHVAEGTPPADMPWLMSAADCLILTSAIEGSPNVVKEALMCDLPVVSVVVGDTRELLDGVEDSHLCDATPESLAQGLCAVLDPPRRSNGRAASRRLTLDAVAERVERIYESVGAPAAAPAATAPTVSGPAGRRSM